MSLMFDWDEANVAHSAEHGVTPGEAEEVVTGGGPLDLEHQTRRGEERLMQIGATAAGRVLVVITTIRGMKMRVVTAYPANRAYRAFYLAHKEDSDDGKTNPS
jgi:uncharacterized protein